MNGLGKRLEEVIKILIGTGLLAFSIQCIYDPCSMVVGGFSGIAIIVKDISSTWVSGGIPLGITTFLLNVPVFLVAYPMKGKGFVGKTLLATILVSLWLSILPETAVVGQDMTLAVIFGGITAGAGIGLVLTCGSTTGGTDMLGSLLQRFFPGYTVVQIMAVLDGIIIGAGAFLFGLESALYAIAAVYVATKISDGIVVGLHYARSVFIVTEMPQKVSEAIFQQLERGVTGIYAQGMYTGNEKNLLFCVVAKKEIVKLKACIFQADPGAFVIVTEAKEVHGEGFRHIEANEM